MFFVYVRVCVCVFLCTHTSTSVLSKLPSEVKIYIMILYQFDLLIQIHASIFFCSLFLIPWVKQFTDPLSLIVRARHQHILGERLIPSGAMHPKNEH